MVGAVLVNPRGELLGEGFHERYGAPHAETMAIRCATAAHGTDVLRDATLYVNLEPCSHEGKTGPCADFILSQCIPRVVIGMRDPNPEAGGGMNRLRDHGVEVCCGILEDECKRMNEAFIRHTASGRPLVAAKIAQTLDGRVADSNGVSRWISGREARQRVHEWRAAHSGILIGEATAARDDPSLTVRHVDGVSPSRYVLDRTGSLPSHLKLFTDRHAAHTTAIVRYGAVPDYAAILTTNGGRIMEVGEQSSHLDLEHILMRLGTEDAIQSLLVEPGPALLQALLAKDLLDRLHIFVAPKLIGSGLLAFSDSLQRPLAHAIRFADTKWETVGQDILFSGFLRAL